VRKHFFQRLWDRLRRGPSPPRQEMQYFDLDLTTSESLYSQAACEQRPPEDLAADLICTGLAKRRASHDLLQRWESLSTREQEVAALICLNYTYRQIAGRLYLSADTVRTYARKAMYKFNTHSREELRILLQDWDFSQWDRRY
jgi:DNA-binding CsgD family transcriptional regulator